MNATNQTIPVGKFVLGALTAVVALNLVLRIGLKFSGVPVTIGIAGTVAWLVATWFAKSAKRAPTSNELSRFIWLYGGILAALSILIIALASLQTSPKLAGILIVAIHLVPYIFFAHLFLVESNFNKFFKA